jgi:2-dehydropantoate 2-reductase
VVRQTCTRVDARSVRAAGAGRLVLGVFAPVPAEAALRERDALAEALRSAGFDLGISQRIQEDRWLKLCVNLMSAPNALVRREDHESRAFVEVKARLLEEARAALAAAGIAARSCDGRDRSLEEEIRYQRESLGLGTSVRRLPLFNAVWTGLREGGDVEADRFHRRILEVAAAGGVPAPVNARVLEVLLAASAPECVRAEELLPAP